MIWKTGLMAVAVSLLTTASGLAASQDPVAGQYFAQAFAQSINDEGACLIQGGSSFPIMVAYGGLSGKLMQARIASAPSMAGNMSVTNIVMPITTGVGTTKPSGTLSLTLTNGAATYVGKGTFSGTIYRNTANTFLMDLSLTYQITGFSQCRAHIPVALAKV